MGRQQSHPVQKLSPHRTRPQKVSSARYAKASERSPLAALHPMARGARGRIQNMNTSRYLQSRSQLSAIREEPVEEEDEELGCKYTHDLYRALDALERDDARGTHIRAREDDEGLMDWDDENTLVAMLQDSAAEEDEEDLSALADKLKAPMSAQGAALKKYMAEIIVPTLTRIKEVHAVLEDKVDLAFGTGILTFNEVCKRVEASALRDEDDIKAAYTLTQDNMQRILGQLQDAYARRDDLWKTLQNDVDERAERAKVTLETLPADLERAIVHLEKKAKELDKDSSAASKQKMLKGILEKL
ncbi:hypothetical protein WOLCODRAFT_135836 [Wolfiporia cocos MD-104 SS10]|uniref:Uncharacterized protein n=1 Tax=Wolfiporia cocos (strain MD-104) TaxID=742152 RepID=A0A2H3J688_WOLCO|nr:hypothetical protein WOLCODRAFT_135836 [Wolfiporia cocos MD-104 SS10]